MRISLLAPAVLIASATIGLALAQPDGPPPDRTLEHEAIQMQQRNAPRPEHKWLAQTVGNYNVKMTLTPQPGAQPIVLQAKSVREMMMDGKFLLERLSCDDPRTPFTAMSIYGFNPDGRNGPRFEIVRYSSMVTCTMPEVGKWDEETKSLLSEGEHEVNGMTGHVRVIHRHASQDKFTAETFLSFEGYSDEFKDQKVPEFKAMVMEFERAK